MSDEKYFVSIAQGWRGEMGRERSFLALVNFAVGLKSKPCSFNLVKNRPNVFVCLFAFFNSFKGFKLIPISGIVFQDPVLNVRLKFCTIPPRLKSLLKLPSDRHLLQQLEQCIRNLLSCEKEPDVCTAVREVSSCQLLLYQVSLITLGFANLLVVL